MELIHISQTASNVDNARRTTLITSLITPSPILLHELTAEVKTLDEQANEGLCVEEQSESESDGRPVFSRLTSSKAEPPVFSRITSESSVDTGLWPPVTPLPSTTLSDGDESTSSMAEPSGIMTSSSTNADITPNTDASSITDAATLSSVTESRTTGASSGDARPSQVPSSEDEDDLTHGSLAAIIITLVLLLLLLIYFSRRWYKQKVERNRYRRFVAGQATRNGVAHRQTVRRPEPVAAGGSGRASRATTGPGVELRSMTV